MDDGMRIGDAATVLGVSIDTLRRWERDGRVAFDRRGQQRYLCTDELLRLLRERSATTAGTRNRLAGIVLDVRRNGVTAQVDIVCGTNRVVSLMPRELVDRLDLKPGDPATAVLRARAVGVERR